MEFQLVKRVVEALLFATDSPVTADRLRSIVDSVGTEQIQNIIEQLNEEYEKEGRCFHIIEVGGGYQFATRPQYATWIRKLYRGRRLSRLSSAALETLAIIAFKGPIIRAEIEVVRGVNVEGVLKTLLERNLITVVGREETPGRPLLYDTTQDFLVYFGLNSLSDLPKPRELEELLDREQESKEVPVPTDEVYASQ